jgi:hypothetical protein
MSHIIQEVGGVPMATGDHLPRLLGVGMEEMVIQAGDPENIQSHPLERGQAEDLLDSPEKVGDPSIRHLTNQGMSSSASTGSKESIRI